tara:strand:+ start:245 stop:421 length:177 start_codon:yes stop_codon:yes gene_type:complete
MLNFHALQLFLLVCIAMLGMGFMGKKVGFMGRGAFFYFSTYLYEFELIHLVKINILFL